MDTKSYSKKKFYFFVSDKAAEKLKEFLKKTGHPNSGLRIRVIPSIEGQLYEMDYEKKADSGDIMIEDGGLKFFINKQSIEKVNGCTIEFNENLDGSSFRLYMPEKKVLI